MISHPKRKHFARGQKSLLHDMCVCWRCQRTLRDPVSIAAGMGPGCRKAEAAQPGSKPRNGNASGPYWTCPGCKLPNSTLDSACEHCGDLRPFPKERKGKRS